MPAALKEAGTGSVNPAKAGGRSHPNPFNREKGCATYPTRYGRRHRLPSGKHRTSSGAKKFSIFPIISERFRSLLRNEVRIGVSADYRRAIEIGLNLCLLPEIAGDKCLLLAKRLGQQPPIRRKEGDAPTLTPLIGRGDVPPTLQDMVAGTGRLKVNTGLHPGQRNFLYSRSFPSISTHCCRMRYALGFRRIIVLQ